MLFDFSGLDITGLLLACIFGFLVGGVRRRQQKKIVAVAADQNMRRAKAIVQDFEEIARQVSQAMRDHRRSVAKFKERVSAAADGRRDADWEDLTMETEQILKPTLALADEIARAYDQLRQQSSMLMNLQESRIDPLTGVGNRRMFNEMLETQFAMTRRYGTQFSLALLDVDHFKQINDSKGHLYGDQVLAQLGSQITTEARETDHVARYGGEEFVILMPETELTGAAEFSDRLRSAIGQSGVTVSVGVASTKHFMNSEELLEAADQALYQAKDAGRNRVYLQSDEGCQAVTPEPAASEPANQQEAITASLTM
jgi:diguanylate cyclase (GGDEF)-like protein